MKKTMITLFLLVMAADSKSREEEGKNSFLNDIYQDIPWVTEFTEDALYNIYQVWPEEEINQRIKDLDGNLKPKNLRRHEIFKRYGFVESDTYNSGFPLGFTKVSKGKAQFNCLLCHASKLEGKVIYGLGNSNLDLDSFFEDLQSYKSGVYFLPSLIFLTYESILGGGYLKVKEGLPQGSTNAMAQSAFVLSMRDKDMNIAIQPYFFENLKAHASDIPAYWTTARKTRLFHDGFAEKAPRSMALFTLAGLGGKEVIYKKGEHLEKMLEYINTLKAPKIDIRRVDSSKALAGQAIFNARCVNCHGDSKSYEDKIIDLKSVKTDSVRVENGLTYQFRKYFGESWLGYDGLAKTIYNPTGYVAPPLNGIWATGPYLHNGSVPTLRDLLAPEEQRPKYWKRANLFEIDYDLGGVTYIELSEPPQNEDIRTKRSYYDTTRESMSNSGHLFGTDLNDSQKTQLIEYLKTL